MFEVICISPSCKQAAEFIDHLMWDLRKRGIYDIEIDPQRMQLKTDKFIVSAIDIFGGKLGLSHHMTEYYIDKISDAEFPNIYMRENAIRRLRNLKSTFREGTKEISEEKLIEILKEV